jgi:hypothetical protein
MAPTIAYIFFAGFRDEGWKKVATPLAYAVSAAWLTALPVLAYHWIAFSHPFSVGSTELEAFGWASLPVTTIRMLETFFGPNEFLYVAPFLVWGIWRLWRTSRRLTGVLCLWLGIITGFHLFYLALRLRDLLAVFPVLALWAGVGFADLLAHVEEIRRPLRRQVVRALSFLLMLTLLRTGGTLLLAFPPMHFNTFGYLLEKQRQAFDTLTTRVPPEATIAASLNAGAVELYADRKAVRPEAWSPEQWLLYVEEILADREQLFILVDGQRMEEPLDVLQEHYHLRPVGLFPLPYFYPDGGSLNREVPLYEVRQEGLTKERISFRGGLPYRIQPHEGRLERETIGGDEFHSPRSDTTTGPFQHDRHAEFLLLPRLDLDPGLS